MDLSELHERIKNDIQDLVRQKTEWENYVTRMKEDRLKIDSEEDYKRFMDMFNGLKSMGLTSRQAFKMICECEVH